jgi:hypothetical protein
MRLAGLDQPGRRRIHDPEGDDRRPALLPLPAAGPRRAAIVRKAPKRIRRRPDPGPYAPDGDFRAAERVAELVAVIGVDGEPTPLVRPRLEPATHSDFDRALCRAGVRRFARERMASDWPEGTVVSPHVLVEELGPGTRRRLPLVVVMGHEMN